MMRISCPLLATLALLCSAAAHELSAERIVFQTEHGDLEMALYPEVAPVTTAHIMHLAKVPACALPGEMRGSTAKAFSLDSVPVLTAWWLQHGQLLQSGQRLRGPMYRCVGYVSCCAS